MSGRIYSQRLDLVPCISCGDKYQPRDGDDMKCYPCYNTTMNELRNLPANSSLRKKEDIKQRQEKLKILRKKEGRSCLESSMFD